jgi:hypothetical protein
MGDERMRVWGVPGAVFSPCGVEVHHKGHNEDHNGHDGTEWVPQSVVSCPASGDCGVRRTDPIEALASIINGLKFIDDGLRPFLVPGPVVPVVVLVVTVVMNPLSPDVRLRTG